MNYDVVSFIYFIINLVEYNYIDIYINIKKIIQNTNT